MASVAPATSNTSPTPCQTAAAVRAFSRRTSQRPSAGRLSRATSIASRVFPTPARPTRVTSRCAATSSPTAARSAARPSSEPEIPPRFPGTGFGAAAAEGELGILAEDLAFQHLQFGAGIQPELVGQQVSGPAGRRPVRRPGDPPGTAP